MHILILYLQFKDKYNKMSITNQLVANTNDDMRPERQRIGEAIAFDYKK